MYKGTALICENGHIATSNVESYPSYQANYCERCGKKLIDKCGECNERIRGDEIDEWLSIVHSLEHAPSYCRNCGSLYPWTKEALKAANELVNEMDKLTPEEKNALNKSLDELINDGPSTLIASNRFKKAMMKVGAETAQTFKSILINVVSEAAKKNIWP